MRREYWLVVVGLVALFMALWGEGMYRAGKEEGYKGGYLDGEMKAYRDCLGGMGK